MKGAGKIVAIVNPKAGTLQSKAGLLSDLEKHFRQINSNYTDFQVLNTEGPGHATELANRAADQEIELCIAIGGDGTVSETARGLIGTETTLGIIPIGSGNGLARHIGISLKPLNALKQLLFGHANKMDAPKVNGRYFFLATGMGFEGMVAHAFAKQKQRGFFQYLASSTASWRAYEPIVLDWEMDGIRVNEPVFTWSAANGSQYGNNAQIAPGASIYDGLFNLAWLSPFPLWRGPELFARLMQGSLKPSQIYHQKAMHTLTVRLEGRQLAHIDGEPTEFEDEVKLEIEPHVLKVIQPKASGV